MNETKQTKVIQNAKIKKLVERIKKSVKEDADSWALEESGLVNEELGIAIYQLPDGASIEFNDVSFLINPKDVEEMMDIYNDKTLDELLEALESKPQTRLKE